MVSDMQQEYVEKTILPDAQGLIAAFVSGDKIPSPRALSYFKKDVILITIIFIPCILL